MENFVLEGRYRVKSQIDKNEYWDTFKGLDTKFDREVIIKIVKNVNQEVDYKDILDKSTLYKISKYDFTPELLDIFEKNMQIYIVEEFIQWDDNFLDIKQNGPFSESLALDIMWDIADALYYLQDLFPSITLGDLNPYSIRITKKREKFSKESYDFNKIKGFSQIKDLISMILMWALKVKSKPIEELKGYLPLSDGKYNPSWDIYSFGAILFYFLTGREPSDFYYKLPSPSTLRPELSEGVCKLVEDCVQVKKENRIRNARELKERLEDVGKSIFIGNEKWRAFRLRDGEEEDIGGNSFYNSGLFGLMNNFFKEVNSFNLFVFLLLLGAIFLFFRSEALNEFNGCTYNLKDLASDIEQYARDNNDKYPDSLGKLIPKYRKSIPKCPSAKKDTYSSSYQVSKDFKNFTIYCKGINHKMIIYRKGYPRFSPRKGIIKYSNK